MRLMMTAAIGLLVTAGYAIGAPRDVQIRSVNIATGVLELHNYGAATEGLDGWRFCSHDEDQVRRYSAVGGLNGQSLDPGESLFVHFNNDADEADEINISTIGGNFAGPLDSGPYAIAIYWQTPFGTGANIADHIQWSVNGIDDTSADERSDEAVVGGVWTSEVAWVATALGSGYIRLTDTSNGVLHGPANYLTLPAMPDCNLNGKDDFFDIADGDSADTDGDLGPDECCPGDVNGDGETSLADFSIMGNNFGAAGTAIREDGDLTADASVTLADFTKLAMDFGCTFTP